MRKRHRIALATTTVTMAAALASPTFGVNIAFDATRSQIIYKHDAENPAEPALNPAEIENVTVRNLTVSGANIPKSSAPGYQMNTGTVLQDGGTGPGNSSGRIGIGYIQDTRTATMTLQSLTFVNQNEIATDPALKMKGPSTISADFTLSWVATGNYGPPLVGRIAIPLSGFVVGSGSATVSLTNVQWLVDQAIDGLDNGTEYAARTNYTGAVTFVSGGPTSATLASTSEVLKTPTGTTLTMKAGDRFTLKGLLTFAADGNSPADTYFEFGSTNYGNAIGDDNPLRFYRLNEDSNYNDNTYYDGEGDGEIDTFDEEGPIRFAYDSSGNGQHGEYVGNVTPEANSAQFSLGTAARFPATTTTFSTQSITPSGFGDVILAPNAPDVQFGDPTGGDAFTLEAWIAREAFLGTGIGNFASIIDMQDGSGNGMRFGINNNAIFLNAGAGGTDAAIVLSPTDFFNLGEFYHLVAVYDGAGNVEFFINGDSVGSVPFALYTNSLDDFIRFGNDINGVSPFIGVIDEIAIYDSALSRVSINRHYTTGEEDSNLIPLIGIQLDETFAIPEPASASLALLALAGLALPRRRRMH